MALARVQAVTAPFESDGTLSLTFAATPGAGRLIVVLISTFRNQNNYAVDTPTDNKGNTYHLAAARADSGNTPQCHIYYAYNIVSSATFTVSFTCSGFGGSSTQLIGCAIEVSGTGAGDPLVGAGTGGSNGNTPSCTTGATGVSDVFVAAITVSYRLNFDITAIVVDSFTPAFTEEAEKLSFTPNEIATEFDSRIDNTGTASGAQACSWVATCFAGQYGGVSAIAAFASTIPPVAAVLHQVARATLEQDGVVNARLTQLARQILYPFTCVSGPTPNPTGCPAVVSATPVVGADGCADEV